MMRHAALLSAVSILCTAACGGTVEPGDAPMPGETPGETPGEESTCLDEDPSLGFELDVKADAWPEQTGSGGGAPPTRSIHAMCAVSSVDENTGFAALSLLCSEGETSAAPVEVRLSNQPSDFHLAIAPGSEILLDYEWHGDGHHLSSGAWLAVHDASRSKLLLGVIDEGGVAFASEHFAQLSLGIDESVCAAPCPAGGLDCDEPHREAVTVEGPDGERAVVVDGNRGQLQIAEQTYDILVPSAKAWSCLNCGASYAVLIGAR